jgi:hypothetical protein
MAVTEPADDDGSDRDPQPQCGIGKVHARTRAASQVSASGAVSSTVM